MPSFNWKPYSMYKTSNYSWIGEIPVHWEICKVKHLFYASKETSEGDGHQILSLTQKGIIKRDISKLEGQIAASYNGYRRINVGDIVLNPMDLRSGFADSSKYSGIISPAYITIKAKNQTSSSFYSTWFQRHYLERIFWPFGKGVSYEHRWTLTNETFFNFPIIKIPPDEQVKINDFIKNVIKITSEIRGKLELELSLLAEMRSILITKSITSGLNSNVKMKQTGLDWCPEVPSHWNLRKVKHLASTMPSNVDKKMYDGQDQVRLANYVDVYNNDKITEDLDLMVATASENEISRFSLMSGDLIITKDSETWDDIAVPAFVPKTIEGVVCGYHLTLIRPNQELVLGEFLFRTFQALGVRDQYHYNANGVTRYGLGSYWVKNGIVPVPPIDEQREISEYIDKNLQIMMMIEEKTLRKVEELKDFQTSLISAAVTGKIDVRGYENE